VQGKTTVFDTHPGGANHVARVRVRSGGGGCSIHRCLGRRDHFGLGAFARTSGAAVPITIATACRDGDRTNGHERRSSRSRHPWRLVAHPSGGAASEPIANQSLCQPDRQSEGP